MTEERITERTDVNGNVTERIIERGEPNMVATPVTVAPASTGGGMSGFIIVILLAVLAVGGYFLFTQETENRKDDAIAEAADNVGAAAEKAGNAVEKAVDKIGN